MSLDLQMLWLHLRSNLERAAFGCALLIIALWLFMLAAHAQVISEAAVTEEVFIADTAFPATTLLYSENENGTLEMRCTATAFEKTGTGYRFVTAAHCAADDDEDKEVARPKHTYFFITADTVGVKAFIPAKVVGAGYRHDGVDCSVLEVTTTAKFPLVPIGHDVNESTGAAVVNIASPLGLGRQVLRGSVSSPHLDRPVEVDDINWTGAMLLQLPGTAGGSSGSAVICLDQRAICGFVVGQIGGTAQVAIPVSRFSKFYSQLKDGKYTHFKAAAE
jgi:hypothetical protein